MPLKNKYVRLFIVFLLQLSVSACEWPGYTKLIVTNFPDDPGFDRNLDSNKITQISGLTYYWPSTSATLQCLNSSGSWVNIGASSVALNPDGSQKNFNSNFPNKVVHAHSWSGGLIMQAAAGCKVTKTQVSTMVTNDWTYYHYQKALTLRAIQPDGAVLPNYSDSERACFGNDPSPDFWQRHADCNVSSNDASYQQVFDEEILRNSNWTTAGVHLNSTGYWTCDYGMAIDGVDFGTYGYLFSNDFNVRVKKGQHTIAFTFKDCVRTGTISTSIGNETVYFSGGGFYHLAMNMSGVQYLQVDL